MTQINLTFPAQQDVVFGQSNDGLTLSFSAPGAVLFSVLGIQGPSGGGGGGVTDGDKGDITVSGSGTVWTIDAGAVTLSKMASLTTSTILGRATAGTGAPEALTPAQVRAILNVADGATANATDASLRDRSTHTGTQAVGTITGLAAIATSGSAADLTGTKAQFDTAVSDGNFLFVGDAPTAHTHVAANITDFSTAADARIGAASINALADVVISSPTLNQVVKYDGTNWTNQADATGGGGVSDGDKGDITVSGAGAVWTIDNGVVTLAKQGNISVNAIIGRITAGTGVPEELTAANVRTIINVANGATANSSDATLLARANHTGTQLAATVSDFSTAVSGNAAVVANTAKVTNATHTGDVTGATALTIAANAVDNTKAADMAANSIKGNNTAGAADPADLTVAQVKTLLAYTPADIGAATSAQANATHTGDATGATALTLATVNSNVGSFGLAASVAQFTVNAKGLITAAVNVAISIASTAISDSTAAGRAFLTAATAAAQTALLDLATTSVKGLAPVRSGVATEYLNGAGAYTVPAGGGGSSGTSIGLSIALSTGAFNL